MHIQGLLLIRLIIISNVRYQCLLIGPGTQWPHKEQQEYTTWPNRLEKDSDSDRMKAIKRTAGKEESEDTYCCRHRVRCVCQHEGKHRPKKKERKKKKTHTGIFWQFQRFTSHWTWEHTGTDLHYYNHSKCQVSSNTYDSFLALSVQLIGLGEMQT